MLTQSLRPTITLSDGTKLTQTIKFSDGAVTLPLEASSSENATARGTNVTGKRFGSFDGRHDTIEGNRRSVGGSR